MSIGRAIKRRKRRLVSSANRKYQLEQCPKRGVQTPIININDDSSLSHFPLLEAALQLGPDLSFLLSIFVLHDRQGEHQGASS